MSLSEVASAETSKAQQLVHYLALKDVLRVSSGDARVSMSPRASLSPPSVTTMHAETTAAAKVTAAAAKVTAAAAKLTSKGRELMQDNAGSAVNQVRVPIARRASAAAVAVLAQRAQRGGNPSAGS